MDPDYKALVVEAGAAGVLGDLRVRPEVFPVAINGWLDDWPSIERKLWLIAGDDA